MPQAAVFLFHQLSASGHLVLIALHSVVQLRMALAGQGLFVNL